MNDFYKKLIENLFDGVYAVDTDRRITSWNLAAERLTGYGREEVVGKKCSENVLRHVDDRGRELCVDGCPLAATMDDGEVRESRIYLHHKSGHRVPVVVRAAPLVDELGQVVGALEVFSHEAKGAASLEYVKRLQERFFVDSGVGLGNRRFAEMTLANLVAGMRESGIGFGVLLLRLDHPLAADGEQGAGLARMAADTLAHVVGGLDTVFSWEPGAFMALYPNLDLEGLSGQADRLCALLAHTYDKGEGRKLSAACSVGGVAARPGEGPMEVIQRAEAAAQQARAAGGNRVHLDR